MLPQGTGMYYQRQNIHNPWFFVEIYFMLYIYFGSMLFSATAQTQDICFIFVFKSIFLFLFFPLISRIMSLSFIHHSHVPIFVFSYILFIFSIVSHSLLKTTQEPLPQDPVKRMLSFTWRKGGGRSILHGWIVAPASSPLHGFVFLEHLSFNKNVYFHCLACKSMWFCQVTLQAKSFDLAFVISNQFPLYFIWFYEILFIQPCFVILFGITILLPKAHKMLWFSKSPWE